MKKIAQSKVLNILILENQFDLILNIIRANNLIKLIKNNNKTIHVI